MVTFVGGLSKFDPVDGVSYAWPFKGRRRWGLACSHHDDPAEVYEAGDGRSHEHLQGRIVLLRRHAVLRGAVRPHRRRLLESATEQGSAVVDVARGRVALDHCRRPRPVGEVPSHVGVPEPVRVRLPRVRQRRRPREVGSDVSQGLVELEHLGAIDDGRVLERPLGPECQVPGLPVLGDGPCVDLVLQRDLDGVLNDGDAPEGAVFWVDAGDATDDEVRATEVKPVRECQGHHRCCAVDLAHPRRQLADGVVAGAVDVRVEYRHPRDVDLDVSEVPESALGQPRVPDISLVLELLAVSDGVLPVAAVHLPC